VGDELDCVQRNRALLGRQAELPEAPLWLEQVHGCDVVETAERTAGCRADAAIARRPRQVCAVLTADCLPLLLCDRGGRAVAAVHAGWRGLAAGVVEAAVGRLGVPARDLLCWLGPAIGPGAFEVGEEVRQRFVSQDAAAATAFRFRDNGRWLADLYALARLRLEALGVASVDGGGLCTYSDAERFFSYRRDGTTGRMASLIWIEG
jgi:YfiH family protein